MKCLDLAGGRLYIIFMFYTLFLEEAPFYWLMREEAPLYWVNLGERLIYFYLCPKLCWLLAGVSFYGPFYA